MVVFKNISVIHIFYSLFLVIKLVVGYSWMSCPPSFNTNPLRGGQLQPVCETNSANAPITKVKAGDRLKVGWTSNNHGGGFVRISLVPDGQHQDENIAMRNVLKYVCYGHDTREGRTKYGDCMHPCNARGGCQYPQVVEDKERFDTTIGIPTNLADGIYILQTAMLVGNGYVPYYSCGKLEITGGNPDLMDCQTDEEPITYDCHKSAGPHIIGHFLHIGARRGNFCFHKDGTRGSVDDNYSQPPINRNCDPRITCGNSVLSMAKCIEQAPSMRTIRYDSVTREPIQPNCANVDEITTTKTTSTNDKNKNIKKTSKPTKSSRNTKEKPEPTKSYKQTTASAKQTTPKDNGKSQSKPTSTISMKQITTGKPDTTPNSAERLSYYDRTSIHAAYVSRDQAVLTLQLHFKKPVPKDHCWELFLQFANPFALRYDDLYNVWFDGMLVERPNRRVVVIQQRPYAKQGSPTAIIYVAMHMFSEDKSIPWDKENIKFITAMVEVLPNAECRTKALYAF